MQAKRKVQGSKSGNMATKIGIIIAIVVGLLILLGYYGNTWLNCPAEKVKTATPPDMKVGNLTITGEIITPKVVVKEDVTTPRVIAKEQVEAPKLVLKEQIEAPKVITDAVETKLFTADKTETPLFEIEKSHTKLSDVDKEHVIKSDVDEQHVTYQHVEKSEVDYMHIKRAEVDKVVVEKAAKVGKTSASAPCKDGNCKKDKVWNPDDPRQPKSGQVSRRIY